MIKYIILSLFLFAGFDSQCQTGTSKIYALLEIGHLNGVGKINYGDLSVENTDGTASRLRLSAGYRLTSYLSIGMGLGLDGYNNPNYNTMPVYLGIKGYLPVQGGEKDLIGYLNLGQAVRAGDAFARGKVVGVGVGYPVGRGKIQFLPSVGFHLQEIQNAKLTLINAATSQISQIESNILLKSICFNIGLLF